MFLKAKEELAIAVNFKDRLAEKKEEFDEIESNADAEILQKIKDLIILNEKLKKAEQEFKDKCRSVEMIFCGRRGQVQAIPISHSVDHVLEASTDRVMTFSFIIFSGNILVVPQLS